MASEKSAVNTVMRNLRDLGEACHLQRIEDAYSSGIPDLNGIMRKTEFWIEFKQVDAWPKRLSTPVRIGLRPEQKLWLIARNAVGGNAFVLCKIEDEWLLFDDHFVALERGVERAELYSLACMQWQGNFKQCVEPFVSRITRFGLYAR